jgi:hypothetical protein
LTLPVATAGAADAMAGMNTSAAAQTTALAVAARRRVRLV